MCLPLAAVALVGTLATTAVGTFAKIQQANAQSAVAEANAANERNAAATDQTNMNMAALRRYTEISRVEGQQRAQAAANGVVVDFGSPGRTVDDTALLGGMDVNAIYRQGFETQRGHDVAISNDNMAASAARSQGVLAGIGGALSIGSSVLGSVKQYGSLSKMFGGSPANPNFGG